MISLLCCENAIRTKTRKWMNFFDMQVIHCLVTAFRLFELVNASSAPEGWPSASL